MWVNYTVCLFRRCCLDHSKSASELWWNVLDEKAAVILPMKVYTGWGNSGLAAQKDLKKNRQEQKQIPETIRKNWSFRFGKNLWLNRHAFQLGTHFCPFERLSFFISRPALFPLSVYFCPTVCVIYNYLDSFVTNAHDDINRSDNYK